MINPTALYKNIHGDFIKLKEIEPNGIHTFYVTDRNGINEKSSHPRSVVVFQATQDRLNEILPVESNTQLTLSL